MPFTVATSQHPVAADAVGEVIGDLLAADDRPPDLVVAFLSPHHERFVHEIGSAIDRLLHPGALVGATAAGVIGGRTEIEDGPAMSLWAAWIGPVTALRADDLDLAAVPLAATLLVLADPFSFPAEGTVDEWVRARPDVAVVGGLASAASAPGGNALLLGTEVVRDGAVVVVLEPGQVVGPVVSQGCRPIGAPLVVTAATGNIIAELAGEPALDRLQRIIDHLPPDDRAQLRNGVFLGIVIDENRDRFGPGDFLVRNVLGADQHRKVLAVGAEVEVGRTVQFHVRDADTASEELHRLLDGVAGAGALVFSCTGRGQALFGVADHDASTVVDMIGTPAVAGMFCAGEIGPVGGRSFVHGYTASVLVLE